MRSLSAGASLAQLMSRTHVLYTNLAKGKLMKQLLTNTTPGRILLVAVRILGLAVSARVIVHIWQNLTPTNIIVGGIAVVILASFTGWINDMIKTEAWRNDLHKAIHTKHLARR